MAKTIIIKLSSEIIADFQSCFDKKENEKAHLYQKITEDINKSTGDVFVKKTCNISILENGKIISKPSTLDEINFYNTEIKSDISWEPKDIAGQLEPYEYVVGTGLWDKILNYCKLFYIINKKLNESTITDFKTRLGEVKLDDKTSPDEIKKKEDIMKNQELQINELITNDCLEAYLHNLFVKPIIEKIKISEKILLDKEFAELNKPQTPQIKNP